MAYKPEDDKPRKDGTNGGDPPAGVNQGANESGGLAGYQMPRTTGFQVTSPPNAAGSFGMNFGDDKKKQQEQQVRKQRVDAKNASEAHGVNGNSGDNGDEVDGFKVGDVNYDTGEVTYGKNPAASIDRQSLYSSIVNPVKKGLRGAADYIGGDDKFYDWYLDKVKKEDEADEKRRDADMKKLQQQKVLASIGDGLAAFHEIYSHARGVEPMPMPKKSLSERWMDRYKELTDERARDRKQYMDTYLRLAQQKRLSRKEREQMRWTDRLNEMKITQMQEQQRLYQEQANSYAQLAADREAEANRKDAEAEKIRQQIENDKTLTEAKRKELEAAAKEKEERANYYRKMAEKAASDAVVNQRKANQSGQVAAAQTNYYNSKAGESKSKTDLNNRTNPNIRGGGSGGSGGRGGNDKNQVKVEEETDERGRTKKKRTYYEQGNGGSGRGEKKPNPMGGGTPSGGGTKSKKKPNPMG